MFAGPNGSGKSFIKAKVAKTLPRIFGIYVNPDEIGKQILASANLRLDFSKYRIKVTEREVFALLRGSGVLAKHGLLDRIDDLRFSSNSLYFPDPGLAPYFASPIADLLHEKLIETRKTFTLETVMSYPGKIDLLKRAKAAGYRTYLYYVATESPEINKKRVENRVSQGGHNVEPGKIEDRYYKSLSNLLKAIGAVDRAYIFDNSGTSPTWFAEITDGSFLEYRSSIVPIWFEKYVIEKDEREAS